MIIALKMGIIPMAPHYYGEIQDGRLNDDRIPKI